jgi:hypothetical protein
MRFLLSSKTPDEKLTASSSTSNRLRSRKPRIVSAGSHEIEVLAIRYLVSINLKRRHVPGVLLEFVVPAKRFVVAWQT